MTAGKEPQEVDIFADERISILITASFGSPLGRVHIERDISEQTARKILHLISNPKKNP